jgi:hypothetical protein
LFRRILSRPRSSGLPSPQACDFIAIDFETANETRGSACAVGVAVVAGGQVVAGASTLIDPQTHFNPYNTMIHGIDEELVRGAPTMQDLWPELTGSDGGREPHRRLRDALKKSGLPRANPRAVPMPDEQGQGSRSAPKPFSCKGWGGGAGGIPASGISSSPKGSRTRAWTLSTLRPGSLQVTAEESAQRQTRGLEDDNTDSDVDGSQQRGACGEWEAGIDASNH